MLIRTWFLIRGQGLTGVKKVRKDKRETKREREREG